MLIKLFSVLFIVFALFLSGCQKQTPVEATNSPENSVTSLAKKSITDLELDGHYIIIAKEEALPAGLDGAVAAPGLVTRLDDGRITSVPLAVLGRRGRARLTPLIVLAVSSGLLLLGLL